MIAAERLRLAWLGLHPDRLRQLLGEHGSASAVVAAMENGTVALSPRLRLRLQTPVGEIHEELRRLGTRPVTREELPPAIRHLPDAPDLLFVRGLLPEAPGVAIVGTRKATAYGRRIARAFGLAVATAGWAVVSGLARGIDGQAHRGSLDAGGPTVAVLGSGIDVVYPPEHRSLAAAAVETGALITEAPPGAPPSAWRFPPRNRIISGLSGAVVVVEAGERGGALITAARSLEQGRPVFVVPGDIDRPSARGCNLLIRDGAHPVLDADDLIDGLAFVMGTPMRATATSHVLLDHMRIGIEVEQLASRVGWPLSRVLQELGQLEAQGRAVFDGSVVFARDREKPT